MSSTIESDTSENGSNLRALLTDTLLNGEDTDDIVIVAPTEDVLDELGTIPFEETTTDRSVTVLMSKRLYLDVRRNFSTASRLEGLPETISFHVIEESDDYTLPDMTLLSSEFELNAIVGIGDDYKLLSSDSEPEAIEAFKTYRGMAEDLAETDFSTPSRSEIYESLAETFGVEVANDFVDLLSTLEDDDRIENADIKADLVAVLVAAKHELSNYEVSRWADDIGIMSQATFSRRKKDLEDRGVIRTSKIPVPIGRSRHRLHLDSEKSLDEIAIDSTDWDLS